MVSSFFFFKQKTAYEMRISDWSSDVCSSDLPAARDDRFGGLHARQSIVSALMQGPEEHYALGEEIARVIWAPILRSHKVTVDQMAQIGRASCRERVCQYV